VRRSLNKEYTPLDTKNVSPVPFDDESLSKELDCWDFDLDGSSEGNIDIAELLDADAEAHEQEELPAIVSSKESSTERLGEEQSQVGSRLSKKRTSDNHILAHGPSHRARKKRVKGLPKRPLSAYNIFFQQERPNILKEFRVGFAQLGKLIGQRWKALSNQERKRFDKLAEKDIARYHREMAVYEDKRRERFNSSGDLDQLSNDLRSAQEHVCFQPTTSRSVADIPVTPGLPPRPAQVWTTSRPVSSVSTTLSPASNTCVVSSPDSPCTWRPHLPYTDPAHPGNCPLMPVPPAMEVVLPDAQGRSHLYKVTYKCYRMSRREADDYMTRLFNSQLPPAPPPGAVPV